MVKCPHTSCPRGKRVRVVLRDGTIIDDRFLERTAKFVVFDSHRFRVGEIKSLTIWRGQ